MIKCKAVKICMILFRLHIFFIIFFVFTWQRERYDKLIQTLVEHVTLREVETKRKKQLAELRMWERKINSVCSDPAKLSVENNVDLELPAMNFIYINELRVSNFTSDSVYA